MFAWMVLYFSTMVMPSLQKHAHATNIDFLALKFRNFQLKNFDIFLNFAQNIDCGYRIEPPRRGGSNEYPQSMFWSKNKKMGIPLHTPILLYKSGVQGGIHFMDMLAVNWVVKQQNKQTIKCRNDYKICFHFFLTRPMLN